MNLQIPAERHLRRKFGSDEKSQQNGVSFWTPPVPDSIRGSGALSEAKKYSGGESPSDWQPGRRRSAPGALASQRRTAVRDDTMGAFFIRAKFTFRASAGNTENSRSGSGQVIFAKKKQERAEHVWMKAFLWALYLPDDPQLRLKGSGC